MLVVQLLALAAILLGAAVRGRLTASLAFTAYLAVGLGHNLAQAAGLVPAGAWLPWTAVDLTQGILVLVIGVEIAFRSFPARRAGLAGAVVAFERGRVALRIAAVLLVTLAASVTWAATQQPATGRELYFALVDASRRTATAAVWLNALALAVIWRGGWSLTPFRRDILAGTLVYSLAVVFLYASFTDAPAHWPVWLYSAVLVLWLVGAWRR